MNQTAMMKGCMNAWCIIKMEMFQLPTLAIGQGEVICYWNVCFAHLTIIPYLASFG